jgi:hypothetical protein
VELRWCVALSGLGLDRTVRAISVGTQRHADAREVLACDWTATIARRLPRFAAWEG